MLVTNIRASRGISGTLVAIVILLAGRVQLDRSQPPGAYGASFDVATTNLALLATVLVAGLAILALRRARRP